MDMLVMRSRINVPLASTETIYEKYKISYSNLKQILQMELQHLLNGHGNILTTL